MKFLHRFLLFAVIWIAVYAASLHLLRRTVTEVTRQLLASRVDEIAQNVTQVMEMERAPIEKFVFDNTFWDEMVSFVRQQDADWAQENIEAAFPTFGVQWLWIYDTRLRRVYSMPRRAPGDPEVDSADLREAFKRSCFEHFFRRSAGGSLIEYFTAPIQPTADAERRTSPQGYLVAARQVDSAYLQRLGNVTGAQMAIVGAPGGSVPPDLGNPTNGEIDVYEPLAGVEGTPIAALSARRVYRALAVMQTTLDTYNLIHAGFGALTVLLLGIFVFAWIRIPLRRTFESLRREDLAPVARYLDARHEFGELARVLRTHLVQREELLKEIDRREQYEDRLREARDLANRSARAKADFLSVMSHELRTPLNTVLGLSNLLLGKDPRPDQVEDLRTLKGSAESLLGLINDVLDFNKMEARRMVLEQRAVDLRAIAKSLLRTFEPQASAKGLHIAAEIAEDVPAWVVGDPLRLSQILGNLLGNAVKFTHTGGVTLGMRTVGAVGARVRLEFRVTDTGIGIPAEKQQHIFELFSQADTDTARRYGGTGLGLTIVKKLLKLMGSTIDVDSSPGHGSTFKFVLDLPTARPASRTAGSVTLPPGLAGKRVLIVEDDPVSRRLTASFLRKWGLDVDVAENGFEAVDKACAHPYELILMDLRMPIMSGIETAARIRQAEGINERTPIVAFTAMNPTEESDAADAARFAGYLVKPVDSDALAEILAEYVKPNPSPDGAGT